MSTYTVTFTQIYCVLPSTGVNRSADDAAQVALDVVSDVSDIGAKVADLLGPEGEVVGAVLGVVSDLADIGSGIGKLVEAIDTRRRDNGGEPDNFYISIGGPTSNKGTIQEAWPKAGSVDHQGVVVKNIAKGDDACAGGPISMKVSSSNKMVCLWDHDLPNMPKFSHDDLLLSIDGTKVGSFAQTFYNAIEDCTYTVAWTVKKA